jgi:multiple sugar transport system permease protein
MKFRALLVLLLLFTSVVHAKTKLMVWGLQSGKETKALDAQIAEFEKRNPDIDVALLPIGDGYIDLQKLMTAAGGLPPAVVNLSDFTAGIEASTNTLLALNEFLEADKNQPSAIQEREYYTAAWQGAKYKGRLYSIPTGADARMLFYNRKMLLQAGFKKPPQSWDELLVYAKKLTKRRQDGSFERIGFIPNYGNAWPYLYSWQNGGEFMSLDGRKCTLNNQHSMEAFRFMIEVYDALGGYDKVNTFQSTFPDGPQNPFLTGKVGMVITGNWTLDSIARYAPNLDFGVAPAPVPLARLRGEGRFKGQPKFITWSSGFSMAIPRGARQSREAWRFIRWMSSSDAVLLGSKAQKRYNESKGRPFVFLYTANKKINERLLREFPVKNKRIQKSQKTFLDILPNSKHRPVTPVATALWDAQMRAFDTAAQHLKSLRMAMNEQTAFVQKELDSFNAQQKKPL